MATLSKFYAVCESGNTDADTVRQFPDRECAELFCDIWRTSHRANAYVREIQQRRMNHPELGQSTLFVELFG